jgi:predicted O-linked N-acetylglucosamine transferase (SPINDLY family)/nitrite reductase/ring-hydroxylating ferredoxin subunit
MHIHIGHMFFGAGNFGDDLMLEGFLAAIADAGADLRLTCATAYDIGAQRRRFPRIDWHPYRPAIRDALIAECDVWLGLGGSILQPLDDHWLLADQLVQLEECRRRDKPAFFLGCSVDWRADADTQPIRRLLDATERIWTRETLSAAALRRMGFTRAAVGADLSHVALQALPLLKSEAAGTGFVCNFERPEHYSLDALAGLIAASSDRDDTAWLVQEVRALPGSELDLYASLPPAARARAALRQPDYQAASVVDLLQSWGRPARIFSSRFHGAIVGAWFGSRVAVFERQQKLRGIAQELELASFAILPAAEQLLSALDRAGPVPRATLDAAADRARRASSEFLDAAAAARTKRRRVESSGTDRRVGVDRSMMSLSPPRIERHALNGITPVGPGRMGLGLTQGQIFVVRGCLQAIGALAPLRAMILDTVEEIAGPLARGKAETLGLTRLHDFVTIEQLMAMNPLMKQRARRLAAGIVADLATLLPDLGPDVHFEDTPNVRIFIPHDVGVEHAAALHAYTKRRGSGGELTLHPPHQDSRHFHPIGAINVWCAIDRVQEANGMSVFPEFYGQHLPCAEADGGILPGQYLGAPVTMALEPGDAWIFETIQPHGSTINQTNDTRFVISFRLTPEAPRYRSKPWYNYVRPAACTAEGPPPNPIDYSNGLPERGPATLDTSTLMPAPIPADFLPDGRIVVSSDMVPEGRIRPVNEDLCVARIDGRPVAFYRGCPHEGADLAGAAIRAGKIVCPWHGLHMSALDGRSGCRSLAALDLVTCAEQNGAVILDPATAYQPRALPVDPHAAAVAHFTAAADRFRTQYVDGGTEPDLARLEQLRHLRDAAIYALLGLPGLVIKTRLEAPVSDLFRDIAASQVQTLGRNAEEQAAFAECCRRLAPVWDDDATYRYSLAALALAWHAHELVPLRPLAQELGWTENFWLDRLLIAPVAFLAPGQADGFADSLLPLMAQVLDRLNRPETSVALRRPFFNSTLFVQSYFNEKDMRPAMRARARVIETILQLEGARLGQLVNRHPSRRRPRVGFIAINVEDRTESVFLLAHLEHLARHGFEVRLYCRADPSGAIGRACRNAVTSYARLPESVIDAAIALRGDDLDIAVFATNLVAVPNFVVLLAAHRLARIQVSATWSPVPSAFRNIDVMISGEYGEPPGAESQYTERLVRLPGSHACFPFHHMLAHQVVTTAPSRAALGIPDSGPVFISAAVGFKILPELSRIWVEILSRVPGSRLILLPFNPNWTKRQDSAPLLQRIERQLHEAGLPADTVHILPPVPTVADLHRLLGIADIYLDSFPYSGACSIYDPVAVGLPIVAWAGQTCRSRQSYAMLRDIGLGDEVATSQANYLERAVRLGLDRDLRAAEAAKVRAVAATGPAFSDTAAYGAKLGAALSALMADWEQRSAALRALSDTEQAERVAALARVAATARPRFSPVDVMEEIVLPYLRHSAKRRFVYAGDRVETMFRAFFPENWLGVLFGPDGKVRSTGNAVPDTAPELGLMGQIERVKFNDASLVCLDSDRHGVSVLAGFDLAAIVPSLILVAVDGRLPGSDPATLRRMLAALRDHGYRAALFAFDDQGIGLGQIGIDQIPAAPGAGMVLFFRAADDGFLPSLIGWLEDIAAPAP